MKLEQAGNVAEIAGAAAVPGGLENAFDPRLVQFMEDEVFRHRGNQSARLLWVDES